jgi:hypothetical protein
MSTVNRPLHDPQPPLADNLPWYHYRWPWVLMLVPFAAVLFGIFMFVTALYYPDDVVVDTYYRDGQAINQLRALDDAAHSLGIGAALEINTTDTRLLLSGTEEPELHLFLYHVTDSNADRSFLFMPDQPGEFVSADSSLAPLLASRGVWYLELRGADNDWRLRKRIETPVTSVSF